MDKTKDLMGETRDELDYATNWVRAYQRLYRDIQWLNAYATINEIAALKILNKFCETFFELDDNVVDKNMKMMLANMEFTKRS